MTKSFSDGVRTTRTEEGERRAEDEDLIRSQQDIQSLPEIELLSQTSFSRRVKADALDADEGGDENKVIGLFRQKLSGKPTRLLLIRLTRQEREEFFAKGGIRFFLHKRIAGARLDEKVRKRLFGELHRLRNDQLTGKAYIEMSNDDMEKPDAIGSLRIATKAKLSISANDERAVLSLSRSEQQIDEEQQKQVDSVIARALSMAVTLE